MANYSQSTTTGSLTTTSATLTVQPGKGVLFAAGLATLYAAGVIEVVNVTSIAGDTLNITRAQAGTAAAAWAAGTQVIQGLNAVTALAAMNAAVSNFKAGATMTGKAQQQVDPTSSLHSVRKSYADATYYPASQPYQTALGYVPVSQAYTATQTAIGWSGSYLYSVVNGVYNGKFWTSANFNPATKAVINSTCNWNSGIVEIGRGDPPTPGYGSTSSSTIDTGSPWVAEGWRTADNPTFPYVRVVWLRNN